MTTAVDVDEKRLATATAKAAIAGFVLRSYEIEDGRTRYSLMRHAWPPRFLTTLSGVEAFLRRVEGRG